MGLVWAPARVGDAHASATGRAGCGAASRCAILRRAAEAIRFGSLARAGRLRAITPVAPVIIFRDERRGGFCVPEIRFTKIVKVCNRWDVARSLARDAAAEPSSPLTKSGSADSLRLCSLRQGDRRWRWGGLRGFRAT